MASRLALSPAMRKQRQPLGQWVQKAPPRGQCFDLDRLTSDLSLTLGTAVSRSASSGAPASASQLLVPRKGIDAGFVGAQNDFAHAMTGACLNNMVLSWRQPAALPQEAPVESRSSSADTTSTTDSLGSTRDSPKLAYGGAGLHQAGAAGRWRKVTPSKLMAEGVLCTSERCPQQDPLPERCRSTGPGRSRDSVLSAGQEGRLLAPKKVTFDDTAKPASPMSLLSLCQTPDSLPPVTKSRHRGSSRRRCSSAAALLEPRTDPNEEVSPASKAH